MAVVNLYIAQPKHLSQLPVRDGNIIFLENSNKVCLDYHDKRYDYETIKTFQTDSEREIFVPDLSGYYFVVETGCLWYYNNGWSRITCPPEDVVTFVDIDLPTVGRSETLYVSKKKQVISIWDTDKNEYLAVSDYTKSVTEDDIANLF